MTITTVGYGDRFPVTLAGRLVGLFVMLTGVGIIAALASIAASLLVHRHPSDDQPATAAESPTSSLADEIAALGAEVAELRAEAGSDVGAEIEHMPGGLPLVSSLCRACGVTDASRRRALADGQWDHRDDARADAVPPPR